MTKISDLKFDDKNFNRHTSYGMSLLEKSLRENGAGRSILIDKDNNIIAGNGIVESAGQIGLENVKIVETTGDEIIAVKRTDLAIDSEEGRRMAFVDNQTSAVDLNWDEEKINVAFDEDFLAKWGKISEQMKSQEKFQDIEEKNIVEIECENETEQQQLYEELTKRGYKCKIS